MEIFNMERRITISYQEFLDTPVDQIQTGTLITGINPRKLRTTQTWFSADKAERAISMFEDGKCTEPVLVQILERAGRKELIIGDGNHRSGVALFAGATVDAEIRPDLVKGNKRTFRFPQIARGYSDLLGFF